MKFLMCCAKFRYDTAYVLLICNVCYYIYCKISNNVALID